ncbi:MAG TPA: MauE/DoxX family redox-associated membrane protein [Ignavibacteriaceae bacterium]|nr:MauE/DoxX family redox-associated membrane protein [Ignavibacteriaceae bacterium]
MKKLLSNSYLLFFFRVVLGFIFIYAGAEKISDPAGFSTSISNYKLLPLYTVNFFAITMPWIEIIAGILLVFGIAVKENALIINAMLIVFLIAISISLARGLSIDCGCFGKGNQIGVQKLIENTLMFLAGSLLMIYDSKIFALKVAHSE